MITTTLNRRICLDSKYIDQDIMTHLLNNLNTTINNHCTQKYGHILKIVKIIKIINHEISRVNTNNIFNVSFEAQIFKPEPGVEIEGVVCMIFTDGIFVNVLDKQKILIPKSNLEDYTFVDDTYKSKNDTINDGDTLKIKVTASRYNNLSFSCFGTIV